MYNMTILVYVVEGQKLRNGDTLCLVVKVVSLLAALCNQNILGCSRVHDRVFCVCVPDSLSGNPIRLIYNPKVEQCDLILFALDSCSRGP